MLCDKCHIKEATIHYMQEIEEGITELHLCKDCAAEYNFEPPNFYVPIPIAKLLGIPELEQSFLPSLSKFSVSPKVKAKRCNFCGISYLEFKEKGRLGCPECYSTFSSELQKILRKIHGNNIQHLGKFPQKIAPSFTIRRDLIELKQKLEVAIKKENYEEAAKIRDEIKAKEKALENSRKNAF